MVTNEPGMKQSLPRIYAEVNTGKEGFRLPCGTLKGSELRKGVKEGEGEMCDKKQTSNRLYVKSSMPPLQYVEYRQLYHFAI